MKQVIAIGAIAVGTIIAIVAIIMPNAFFANPDEKPPILVLTPEGNNTEVFKVAERDWPTSGPFKIDRSEYLLGENIFLEVSGLNVNEKGQIVVLRPKNVTHYKVWKTIPFDGSIKQNFNNYFRPDIAGLIGICSQNDLIGNWTIVFQGTSYNNISFEIVNKTLPGDADHYFVNKC